MLAVTLRENALTTLDALKTSLGIDPEEEDAQRDATLVQLINGHTLQVGAQFRDGFDGQIYTVKQELTHGPVHSMKRYMVEKKGESNPK